MRKTRLLNLPIAIILMLVSILCIVLMIISVLKLPEIPKVNSENESLQSSEELSKLGKMMVEMLPTDLAFTVFVPSERAFERDLRLNANHSFSSEEWDNTYATVSQVLGFSAVPRRIYSDSIAVGSKESFDSISGFGLYILKDSDGRLVVNRVRSSRVDVKKGEVVVHIMDGVLMDSHFEQSVLPDGYEQE